MNYTGPKVRVSRRLGVALTPKAGKVMNKKSHPPGLHGTSQDRRRQRTIYGRQLLEKQRLRCFYNVHERQLRHYYKKATRMAGAAGDNMITLMESRLDATVLRGGLARTIYAARQYVSHGLVLVNGKRVDKPSVPVSVGDVITIKDKKKELVCFEEALVSAQPPSYLELNRDGRTIKVLGGPVPSEIPVVRDLQMSLIIEFYSR